MILANLAVTGESFSWMPECRVRLCAMIQAQVSFGVPRCNWNLTLPWQTKREPRCTYGSRFLRSVPEHRAEENKLN